MQRTRWAWVGAGVAVACAACGAGGGDTAGTAEAPLELTLGHVGAPGSLYDVVAAEFARRVGEASDGTIRVEVFGSSQLGGDEVMLQKLRLGTVDISFPSTVLSSSIDAFGLFEMPYLVADRDHMRRIEDELFWSELAPLAEAQGYGILAVWENGFRHVTNSRRPIVGPEDLRGLKLRTPRGRWRVKLFQAYGANPTPMPFSEVFIALQTGVMDAQENPLVQVHSAKLYEVQRYLSLTGHVYSPSFPTVGLARWNRLPEDVRRVVERVARDMQPWVYETAARIDAELLDSLSATPLEINQADVEAFRAASGPIYAEFGSEVAGGRELVERALAVRTVAPEAAGAGSGTP